eukprot:gnl/TRDRNA2_/TRDRNA2_166441_c4_seq5.p1 gnl/TRDRNA2_/TRDRNA2_166441_c4~~gnl/TRDRNA2_/TRDRNA2_166441_c4_seq5.p1  ORF type:complete len:151 (+),score=27.59 gnl/TRDRNA2_/TRDRNA2_166441_c4_seq5:579-1031(+)
MCQLDAKLSGLLVSAAEQRTADFDVKSLVNLSWALATAGRGEPRPALLDVLSMLDLIESQDANCKAMCYQMVLESLVATGQIAAGFDLLGRVEAGGLLSEFEGNCYSIFRALVEACRVIDLDKASRVQVVMDRLGLTASHSVARPLEGSL